MINKFINSYWLKVSLITILLLPFLLLWGELFTRMLLPQNVDSKMNIFKADPIVGFTYQPNASTYEKGREYNALFQINSLGLRDREYGPRKPGDFRVMLVGDSFSVSHGLPIEDSLSRQLERALQSQAEKDGLDLNIEVINTAHGGYSPFNYWKSYDRWASVFSPDVVVVGISPDDYDCSNEDSQYLIEDGETLALFKNGQAPERFESSSIRRIRKWLAGNSEFYILLRNFLYYNDLVGRINLWMGAKAGTENTQVQQFLVPQPEEIRDAWENSFSYLQKLKNDTAEDGVEMILIPIPLKMEIDQDELAYTLSASGLTPASIDINQPLQQISSFGKEKGIPVLDPRPALKNRHAEERCYFVYDGHWIEPGIRAASESLVSQWSEMKILPWKDENSGHR